MTDENLNTNDDANANPANPANDKADEHVTPPNDAPVDDATGDNDSGVTPPVDEANDTAEAEPEQTEKEEAEAPEWFMKDKFKSTEEQAKAYSELQKKMGKYWGAPSETYQVEGIEGIAKDDPLLENLIPGLKEIGLSQEGFQTLVKSYQDANIAMMKNMEAELKKELTTKDAATYQAVDKWMTENLTAEEREQVQNNWLMSAADFKLFNQLRLMAAPSTNVPSTLDGSGSRFESSKEVENDKIKYRKEVNQGIRAQDKNYENELAARFRDAKGRELRGK